METAGEVAKKALDLLKHENQEKQTGSPDFCEIHPKERVWLKRTYSGDVWVCETCMDEAAEQKKITDAIHFAHKGLGLPERLQSLDFGNYVATSTNMGMAKDACQDYASGVCSGHEGGLIMLGGVGTGKTHLAVAICKTVCDAGKSAHLTSVPKMIREIRATWSGKATDDFGRAMSEDEVISKLARYALLVIDEIGVQYGTPAEKIPIAEVINERYNRMLPTVIIGNVSMSEVVDFLGLRVVDRIKDNGRIVLFDWQSHRTVKK